jgi:hypothetical protein
MPDSPKSTMRRCFEAGGRIESEADKRLADF